MKPDRYRPTRQKASGQSGSVLAEFGIVMVVFSAVMFGFVEAGRLLWSHQLISNAASEAVRYAVVRGDASRQEASSTQIAAVASQWAIGLSPLTVDVTWDPDNKPGSVVRVEVEYDFLPVVPLWARSIHLSTASQMVISR